jgi:lysophospholipase L1-like esterase
MAERDPMKLKFRSTAMCFHLLVFLSTTIVLFGCSEGSAVSRSTPRFLSVIESFLKEDQTSPPQQGTILFIGSSIFRQWKNLKQQMAPLPVFNRAFGGSRTLDILNYMDAIVLPYRPKVIVYYCGSNDINASEKPADIANRFKTFWWRVSAELPATKVLYVSINRAPQKKEKWNLVDSTNALVREFCSTSDKLQFIDVNAILFDMKGVPRYELYREDQLHFKDEAYEEFTLVIKPYVEQAWK